MEDIKDLTISELIQGVSSDKDRADDSYNTMPMFDPEAYDSSEDGDNTTITESIRKEFSDRLDALILKERAIPEGKTVMNEASAKMLAVANFLNSHAIEDQNYNVYVAEGYENQVPLGNAANFASFKTNAKKAGLLSNNGQGANVRNISSVEKSDAEIAQEAGLVQKELSAEEQEAVDAMAALRKTRASIKDDLTAARTGEQKFLKMEQYITKFIKGSCPKLTIIAGAPGVGKTYTVNKIIDGLCGKGAFERLKMNPIAIPNSKDKLIWKAGTDTGGSSGTLKTCFRYRRHCAVIFNDCDTLLAAGKNADNVMKNLFEQGATVVNVPGSQGGGKNGEITKLYQQELEGNSIYESAGIEFGIDMKALREDAILTVTCNGKVIEDKPVSIKEATGLLKAFGETPNFKFLNESWASSLKESVFDDIDPDSTDEDIDTENSEDLDNSDDMLNDDFVGYSEDLGVTKFRFSSRFMFITNKHKDQINDAVYDRAAALDIVLTPEEYLERLAAVKDKILCNEGHNDPYIEKTARDVVYKLIKCYIHAAKSGVLFDGSRIIISPDALTFRMYDKMVTEYCSQCEVYLGNNRFNVKTLEDIQNNDEFSVEFNIALEEVLSGKR